MAAMCNQCPCQAFANWYVLCFHFTCIKNLPRACQYLYQFMFQLQTCQTAHLMCKNVDYFTELLQFMKVYEAGAQGVIQDGGQGVHEGAQAGTLWVLPWKEMVK